MNWEIWMGIGGYVLSFAIGWGMQRAKSVELERRIEEAEKEQEKQRDRIDGLREVYVSYLHFNEIMTTLRESQRETNSKMDRILELLSTRV